MLPRRLFLTRATGPTAAVCLRWQSSKGGAAKPAVTKGPTHFGFATGKAPSPGVAGHTQKKPPPTSPSDPRLKATSSPLFHPLRPNEGLPVSKVEMYRAAADRYFNDMAQKEPWMHYVRENIQGLLMWQLVIEQGLTLVVALLFGFGVLTTAGTNDFILRWTRFDMGLDTSCVWEDDLYIMGSSHPNDASRSIKLPKAWLTLYSQAHQIAFATILLQIPLTYKTYWIAEAIAAKIPASRWMQRAEKLRDIETAKKAAMSPPGNYNVF